MNKSKSFEPDFRYSPETWKTIPLGHVFGWGYRSLYLFFWLLWTAIILIEPPKEKWTFMVIFGIINSLLTLSDILSKQGVTYSPQRKKLIFFASVIGMREVDEIPVDQIQSVFLEQISEKWGSEASVNRPISSVRNELYYTIAFQNEDEIHYGAKHDNFPMLENCAIELAKDFKIPYQGIRRNGMFFNS